MDCLENRCQNDGRVTRDNDGEAEKAATAGNEQYRRQLVPQTRKATLILLLLVKTIDSFVSSEEVGSTSNSEYILCCKGPAILATVMSLSAAVHWLRCREKHVRKGQADERSCTEKIARQILKKAQQDFFFSISHKTKLATSRVL